MIPSKFTLLALAFLMALATTCILGLQNSEKNGTIKQQEKTISLQQTQIDTLTKALEDKPTNANTINLQFDKTKLKNGSTLVLDATQLQALACDTVKIIEYYNKLKPKEQRKLLRK